MIRQKLGDYIFTEDGYIVEDGYYIGVNGDKFECHGDYELCKKELEPIIKVEYLDKLENYMRLFREY